MSIFKKISLLWKSRKVVNEVLSQKENVQEAYEKSSWKSTEFWAAVLTGVGSILATAQGILPLPWGGIVMAAGPVFYALSRGLAKRDDPLGGIKPGYATTEFWLALGTSVSGLAMALQHVLPPEWASVVIMVSTGIYQVSRGLSKSGAQPTA